MYSFDYVIYHLAKPKVNCPDGIAAAWVCHKYNPQAKILGMSYGEELPILPDNCSVMCVDFSFSQNQLDEMRSRGIKVTIIDHHVSAFELLTSLQGQIVNKYIKLNNNKDLSESENNKENQKISNFNEYQYIYDISECGATLTWKTVPMLRRNLGIIYQDFRLLTDRNVYENLEFVLKATGWKDTLLIKEKIESVLQKVGLKNKGFKMPYEMSGGEQQRVDIARALLNNPKLILADEPTGNLDPETTDEIMQLLWSICSDYNTTIIMATHDYSIIQKFPSKVLKVEQGKVFETNMAAGII